MAKAKGKTAPKSAEPKSKIMLGASRESAQRRKAQFAERWLVNGNNASEAAIFAGYSPNGAAVAGSRMLSDPIVQAIIGPRKNEALDRARLSTERWAAEMAAIGHFDPGELYDEDGKLIPIHKLPEHVRRAISTIESTTDKDGNKTDYVKPHDKNTALANIGRHLGVFDKDNNQRKSPIQIAIQLVGE